MYFIQYWREEIPETGTLPMSSFVKDMSHKQGKFFTF